MFSGRPESIQINAERKQAVAERRIGAEIRVTLSMVAKQ
jgi:hypothetical protein